MFGAYLQGFIGIISVIVGIGFFVAGLFDPVNFLIAFILVFGGGYLKYLSQQTTRSIDSYGANEFGMAGGTTNRVQVFSGDRSIDNDDYQLYLVDKYNIKKNETLGKFAINGKLLSDLDAALRLADELDKPIKLVSPPDFNMVVKEHKVKNKTGFFVTVYEFPESTYYLEQIGGYVTFKSVNEAEIFLKK